MKHKLYILIISISIISYSTIIAQPYSNNKGELRLYLSLPQVNSFRMIPKNDSPKNGTGLWGLSVGLDCYHSNNQFINFALSCVTDYIIPIPSSIELGSTESLGSIYIGLSNNYKIKRFTIGYGLSYVRNTLRYWDKSRIDPITGEYNLAKKSHNALGLIFPAYFEITSFFNIGVIYRPTFYRPNMTEKTLYEHLISIDFAFKIRLRKSG